MKLSCKKCGTVLDLSSKRLEPGERVECPSCKTRYRLRAKHTPGPTSAPFHATRSPTTPAAPKPIGTSPAPPDPVDTELPTRRLEGAPSPGSTLPSTPASGTTPGGARPALSVFAPEDRIAERYRVVRFLARGGMGEVYEVEDLELGGRLALKTIVAGKGESETIERFKREIQLARRVTHPNVCRIFDFGQHRIDGIEPVVFLTMELLRGETLADQLRRRGSMRPEVCAPLIRQMAWALDAAHQAGVVHRDLKSENVFLVPDGAGTRLVITDFGIARGGSDRMAAQLTGTASIGTPAYMAPEQVEGKVATPAADIYALGVVMFEMVTGRLPFDAPDPIAAAVKRLNEDPPSPRMHAPGIEPAWEAVILRCLARDPQDRFPSAGALAAALPAGTETAGSLQPMITPGGGGPSFPTGTPPMATGAPTIPGTRPAPVDTEQPTMVSVATAPAAATATATAAAGSHERAGGRRIRRLLVALALVLAVSAGLWAWNLLRPGDDARHLSAPRRSVAVLGFRNLSGNADDGWLDTALAEMLATELAQADSLRVVPGATVARMRDELSLEPGEALEAAILERVRTLLGCDVVSTGSFVAMGGQSGGQLRLDLKLQDAASGLLLGAIAYDAPRADLFELIRKAGRDIRARLGAEEPSGARRSSLPTDPRAARLYAEALDLLRGVEPVAARDRLLEAARHEGDNAQIQLALSTAWQALGYPNEAGEAAARAFELSADLDRETRLEIEGHYRETLADWDAAAATFQALWDYRPDNLEYGLRLATAHTAAFRPDDALTAVAAMRSLPPPLGDDLRIDLAESRAHSVRSDFEGQRAAASAAAEKARALGAGLMLAQAEIAHSSSLRSLGKHEEATAAAEAALAAYRRLDHAAGVAQALVNLASAHYEQGDLEAARATFTEALEGYRAIGDRRGEAAVLGSLALALRKRGHFDQAASLYREALATFRDTGDRPAMANTLNNLAALDAAREQLGQALDMLRQSLTIWQEIDNKSGQGYALANIAGVLRRGGDLAGALDEGRKALALRREIGHPVGEMSSLSGLAAVHLDRGELDQAADHVERAAALAEDIVVPAMRAEIRARSAEVSRLRGDLEAARAGHEAALALRQQLDDPLAISDSRLALARLALDQGRPGTAAVEALRAAETFRAQGRPGQAVRAAALMVRAHLADGATGEARRIAAEVAVGAADTELAVARFEAAIAVALAGADPAAAAETLERDRNLMAATGYGALALDADLAIAELALRRGDRETARARAAEAAEQAAAVGLALLQARAAALAE